MALTQAFRRVLDEGQVGFVNPPRDPALEPRKGDRLSRRTRGGEQVREVVRTFFSDFAHKRFVVYRTPSGRCASVAIDAWRSWAGVEPQSGSAAA